MIFTPKFLKVIGKVEKKIKLLKSYFIFMFWGSYMIKNI